MNPDITARLIPDAACIIPVGYEFLHVIDSVIDVRSTDSGATFQRRAAMVIFPSVGNGSTRRLSVARTTSGALGHYLQRGGDGHQKSEHDGEKNQRYRKGARGTAKARKYAKARKRCGQSF